MNSWPLLPDEGKVAIAGKARQRFCFIRSKFLLHDFYHCVNAHPCHRRDAMRMRLARQFMHDELLRPRTYCSRTLTIRNPAFDSQTLSTYSAFFHLPPPPSSLSPGRLRSVFGALIIIHRATTVAQRLLLADYTSGLSWNRSFARLNVVFGCIVSLARVRKHALTRGSEITAFITKK